ncbi:hypothetical protein QLQ15_01560 [Lysobacter sp. LF1]|uniref:Uncharacterized protein n=1 Tax=Lysobacter stagni TaxID=3045172 RepID=A0ABT6XBS7_9GAMM|nr:hypothetical protein [Lysobacter sp. LF1]MDI9237595.1 hypothetical protein [Lysobacter sp. LF1]
MHWFVLRPASVHARAAGIALVLLLCACGREAPTTTTQGAPVAALPDLPPKDVFERNAESIVGISYPTTAQLPAALAQRLTAHAAGLQSELSTALRTRKAGDAPYELTATYAVTAETPRLIVVVADSSLYIGAATSRLRQDAFVWERQAGRLLTADELIHDGAGWKAIDAYLHMPTDEGAAVRTVRSPHLLVPRLNSRGEVYAVAVSTAPAGAVDTELVDVPVAIVKPWIGAAHASLFGVVSSATSGESLAAP